MTEPMNVMNVTSVIMNATSVECVMGETNAMDVMSVMNVMYVMTRDRLQT